MYSIYQDLIDRLKAIHRSRKQNSEHNSCMCAHEAMRAIQDANLDKETRYRLIDDIMKGNPSGYYWDCDGTKYAIDSLEVLKIKLRQAANDDSIPSFTKQGVA